MEPLYCVFRQVTFEWERSDQAETRNIFPIGNDSPPHEALREIKAVRSNELDVFYVITCVNHV